MRSPRAEDRRLAEATLPLRQISLDSVHEKNVRHGHISTLHIWPARRPLAASRAMLLATLLPDPGDDEGRRELGRRIAGRLVPKKFKGGAEDPKLKETAGGVLHWGQETDPELDRLREEIREAFGGRAPRVLDPFAGGGAIPLEAMRLGCETFASDLNPVAWFILRCTLHYPKLVGREERPLPAFALRDRNFATALVKSRGARTKVQIRNALAELGHRDGGDVQLSSSVLRDDANAKANFAWHVRAWGLRVLEGVRRQLATRYPTYAEFEPVRRRGQAHASRAEPKPYKRREPRLLEPDADGHLSVDTLNAGFDEAYLKDEANPRWVAKPVVAYLWARTTECGGCRAEIPLLKTRWLCKKSSPVKRVLLTMTKRADGRGVEFAVATDVPKGSGSAAQQRQHDQVLGAGTMSASGVECPNCAAVTGMAELRAQGRSGRLGARMTAVVVDGQTGKEYRSPTERDIEATSVSRGELEALYSDVPYGMPNDPTADEDALGMRVARYGFDSWDKLFTCRQLLTLGTFSREIRSVATAMDGYSDEWREALTVYLACAFSKLSDYSSAVCSWHNSGEKLRQTFARFALPMVWDYCEVNPLSATTGGFRGMLEWVARYADHALPAGSHAPCVEVETRSAIAAQPTGLDVICTDPPYYDAIPYSDLMDFFQVWLRRVLHGLSSATDAAFADPLGPKWESGASDGELIDDASRFKGNREASKSNYEEGMARAFRRFHGALGDDGRLVIVFANKSPDAWETLVSALIRAGFVVTGSWPIQTEMQTRQRAMSSAALASSIWLVCRKRTAPVNPGWERNVLSEMREKITQRLRDFWDAGIRGPDFVWSATGPALEAFSRHPVVKRADRPGDVLTVADFLRHVRRMVVGFVVGQLLSQRNGAATELDDVTTYYLLHRNDFGLEAAPAGACILYALSCNLSDADLASRHDLLARGGRASATASDEEGAEAQRTSGSEVRLKGWNQRRGHRLGQPTADGATPALIDCVHKVMQLWKTGEQARVNSYLSDRGLWKHELFASVVQAVIELAERGSEERALLESVQNHLRDHNPAATPALPVQGSLL
ncbi:DUF1156 domain-containing protein [Candidatus Palauibacter sp.]|uniref:DUF1156 domain-containing protein n=1 Tax=Candidatus Palauibacter sp. TaxID=3101350 RepID=UPI003B021511